MGNIGFGRSEEQGYQDTRFYLIETKTFNGLYRFSEDVYRSRGAFSHGSGATQSTKEFKQFVFEEFRKSSEAIGKKFTEFIDARWLLFLNIL